ncbi:NF-kappa-B-repressing factor, partial [Armadillidium nasatum]
LVIKTLIGKSHSTSVDLPLCATNGDERKYSQECPSAILGDAAMYPPNLLPDDPYTSNIFLIRHNYSNFLGFYQLLKVSLQFSNLQLDEDYEMTLNYIYCTMTAKGVGKNLLLARGQGKTQREARNKTSEEALEMLLKKCFTLQVHKKASGDGEVSLSGIDGNFGSDFEKISDDNVGAKLLKMMGWSGGALGKTGEGITEPVQTSTVIGRQGLGVQNEAGVTPQFVNKVRYLIKKFRFSEDTSDLIFSSDLSAEQRKQIHIYCFSNG